MLSCWSEAKDNLTSALSQRSLTSKDRTNVFRVMILKAIVESPRPNVKSFVTMIHDAFSLTIRLMELVIQEMLLDRFKKVVSLGFPMRKRYLETRVSMMAQLWTKFLRLSANLTLTKNRLDKVSTCATMVLVKSKVLSQNAKSIATRHRIATDLTTQVVNVSLLAHRTSWRVQHQDPTSM